MIFLSSYKNCIKVFLNWNMIFVITWICVLGTWSLIFKSWIDSNSLWDEIYGFCYCFASLLFCSQSILLPFPGFCIFHFSLHAGSIPFLPPSFSECKSLATVKYCHCCLFLEMRISKTFIEHFLEDVREREGRGRMMVVLL